MKNKYASILVVCGLLSVLLLLAVFYLRLGFFLQYVWSVGLGLACLFTYRRWRTKSGIQTPMLALVIITYCGMQYATWLLLTNQEDTEVHQMSWHVGSSYNEY